MILLVTQRHFILLNAAILANQKMRGGQIISATNKPTSFVSLLIIRANGL
jgi:hypothetical protein